MLEPVEFAKSVMGLLAALLGLVAAILGLIGRHHVVQAPARKTRVLRMVEGTVLLGVLLVVVVAALRYAPGPCPQEDRQCNLREAFRALDRGRWARVVRQSEAVMGSLGIASLDQERLAKAGVPLPPTGMVPDEERRRIHARGVLNDVAAALWLRGKALQQLGDPAGARKAYQEAAALTYARVYDPSKDEFWSPADAAGGLLRMLPR